MPERNECPNEDEEDCCECLKCSSFCDVCGSWYHKEDPCEYH